MREPKAGEVVIMDFKRKSYTERYEVVITWVEDRGDRWYFGFKPSNNEIYFCGFGAATIYKDEEENEKKFGVTIRGDGRPEIYIKHWTPTPKDRSYTNM
jgi:hypothetical protein